MSCILAFESSTAYGGVALSVDNQITEKASHRLKSHSEVLNLYVDELLKDKIKTLKDVDVFAVGIGPGSFTGIRVSLNSAKSFAYSLNKPLIEVNSLENLAMGNASLIAQGEQLLPMINAYKNMVYTAVYEIKNSKLLCLVEPTVVRVQDLNSFVRNSPIAIGDGFTSFEKYFSPELKAKLLRPEGLFDYPQPRLTALLAAEKMCSTQPESLKKWHEVKALYLRASEAEENKKGIKYEAL